jgi:hypothetical protein
LIRPVCALAAAVLLAFASTARAQLPAADRGGTRPAVAPVPVDIGIESTLSSGTLDDLPTAGSLFAVLETTQPEIIGDRFDVGGLDAGQPARLGAFLGSSTQTVFRVGDVDITDPDGSGTPLLFPDLFPWRMATVRTGLMPVDVNAAAVAVSLDPKRPAAAWTGRAEATFSGAGLASDRSSLLAPPVARLAGWGRGAATVAGPVSPRVGLSAGAAWTSASQFERGAPVSVDDSVGSAFAHVVFAATPSSELRALALLQRASYPAAGRIGYQQSLGSEVDHSVHLQSTWEHRSASAGTWRALVALTQRTRTPDALSGRPLLDRLQDGPAALILEDVETTDRRWTLGGRVTPRSVTFAGRPQALALGADLERATMNTPASFAGSVGEQIDGIPSRIWTFTAPGPRSNRAATTVAAFVSDRFDLASRLTLDLGLRYEGVSASAAGAANGVAWHTWLPRASLSLAISQRAGLSAIVGYRRSAYRLPLALLAWGDPAAPVGSVYASNGSGSPPLVARVGPGTGGDPGFSSIDPALARPTTDELVIGLQAQPSPALRMALTGFARRERHLIAVVDTGVPTTDYAVLGVADPGLDLQHTTDDQVLPVYDRLPGSFGQDRYLVTNPADEPAATMSGLKASIEASTNRLFVLFGATASLAKAPAASLGYHVTENDQDLVGELYVDPNAATFARGRPFVDRAYTMKLTTVYHFPHDIRAGVIARYQDGQPFARIIVVPGLHQGAEAIRAFADGDSRFTFTGTLDLRLQKGLTIGRRRVALIADAFNLINLGNEVEERVVTGDRFRTVIATQPPRAVHLGARIEF